MITMNDIEGNDDDDDLNHDYDKDHILTSTYNANDGDDNNSDNS